jgi:hypothetical protein
LEGADFSEVPTEGRWWSGELSKRKRIDDLKIVE